MVGRGWLVNGIGCFVVVCSESGMTLVGSGLSFVDGEMNCMDLGQNFVLRYTQVMKNLGM